MLAKINADNNHPSVHSLTSQYLINLQTQDRTTCRVQCAMLGSSLSLCLGLGYVNGSRSWMSSLGRDGSEIKLDE